MSAQSLRGEEVKVYAAAVVKTPLGVLADDFERTTGAKVSVVYDTAGSTQQRFLADPAAEVLITTVALIRSAEGAGTLRDGVSMPLGRTVAGVAVAPGAPKPDVSTPEALKAAMLAAPRIAVSDPARGATVGIHFMKVIEALGVKDAIVPKIVTARDGVETVRFVIDGKADIGVSQSSEIVQGDPQSFAGPFPQELALTTDFSLWHRRSLSPAAAGLVALLMEPVGQARLAADGVMVAGTL